MAVGSSDICKDFERAILTGEHNFTLDTFKVALYDNSADISNETTAYSDALVGQIAAGGDYLQGGSVINLTLAEDDVGYHISGENVEFTRLPNPRTVRGLLLYNDSHLNKGAVAVFNLGYDHVIIDGHLLLEFMRESLGVPVIRIHADTL